MDTNGKSSPRGCCIPICVVGAGLLANRSMADVQEIIVPVPIGVVDASDKRSPRGRGIPSFIMDVGLPANKSKADLREIIVPVPTCVTIDIEAPRFDRYKISATAKFRNAVS